MGHGDLIRENIKCCVLTVSTSRTDKTDKSGAIIKELLEEDGHVIYNYDLVSDDPEMIENQVKESIRSDARVLIITGGTGLSRRDHTVDVLIDMEDIHIPGFGELFRALSYEDIGPRAALSRARASRISDLLVFALPGSTNAVRLGMKKIILPTIGHAVYELDKEGGPGEG